MFDKDQLVADCQAALQEKDARLAVRDIVARAVSTPAEVFRALGEPREAGILTIHRSPDLTVLSIAWGPQMRFRPHDHRMWAVIGIYAGREDNVFFQRSAAGLTRHGTRELHVGDVAPLGEAAIHAVNNPLDQLTVALHVYGGDFFAAPRSEWDPRTFAEKPYDVEATMRAFREANQALRAGQAGE
jgi:predicted metal-dependent enzyme (double-stranded beta helix superfamily)